MTLLRSLDTAASGLSAQRVRLEVASENLANATTTRTPEGGPYRRKEVVLESTRSEAAFGPSEASGSSVSVGEVREDQRGPRLLYEPGHPDADANGYVAYPNVSVIEEMVDMITASRAYEAGLTAAGNTIQMAERALEIGRWPRPGRCFRSCRTGRNRGGGRFDANGARHRRDPRGDDRAREGRHLPALRGPGQKPRDRSLS